MTLIIFTYFKYQNALQPGFFPPFNFLKFFVPSAWKD